MSRPVLEISQRAFLDNLAALSTQIAPGRVMLVMKDDAYGHGIDWAAEAAEGIEWFGAYDIATALHVRARRPFPARVLAWATCADDEVAEAIAADVDLGIGTAEYLRRVVAQARALGRIARVHLKIDTGLHRNGVRPEDWPAFAAETRDAERAGIVAVVGVWSHLAEASDAEDDEAREVFAAAVDGLRAVGSRPEVLHLTASAASWWRPELRGSLSRIGAFCYGIRSADGPEIPGVVPIARLTAPVLSVADGRAQVGVGSFDGLPSTLAGVEVGTPAGPRRMLEIGPYTSVVEGWPGAGVADVVRVFGPGDLGEADATGLAERIGTVGEEILTRLTPHVRRVVIE